MQEVYDAVQKNDLQSFADRYCYGDMAAAEIEIARKYDLHSPERISDAAGIFNDMKIRFDATIQSCATDVLQKAHYAVRMTTWVSFYEPRKRYRIEGGIVDVIFRELLFNNVRDLLPQEWRAAQTALQIPPQEFQAFLQQSYWDRNRQQLSSHEVNR